jgi:hypothetical protein
MCGLHLCQRGEKMDELQSTSGFETIAWKCSGRWPANKMAKPNAVVSGHSPLNDELVLLRLDDPTQLDFWLEVPVRKEYLREILKEMDSQELEDHYSDNVKDDGHYSNS